MQPIISGIRSITNSLAQYFADLLKPLVGKTERHIQISKDLVETMEGVDIEGAEVITSFYVIALFASVPGKEMVSMAI